MKTKKLVPTKQNKPDYAADLSSMTLDDFAWVPFDCAKNLPHGSGVYVVASCRLNRLDQNADVMLPDPFFLYKVLYVGQSGNLRKRFYSHHKKKDFEKYSNLRIFFLPKPLKDLDKFESGLIWRFKPIMNQRWNPVRRKPVAKIPNWVYLPKPAKNRLDALAKHEGCSVQILLLRLIEKAIEEAESKGIDLNG